ncbi:MAG: hypothetical protein E2591_00780 [Achromobacter sp.]|uniref:GDSL-type esterase/lipase family protein n=1 Tax=Achromobacter sp. TaxID=134375 RepID=UPI0012C5B630|nr:hypothetical protein [Achromobacter sp.]
MAGYLTKQELLNGSVDAGTLGEFANGAVGAPNVNRAGSDVKNLQTLRVEALDAAFAAADIKTYLTKAAMQADTGRPVPSTGRVTKDPILSNNGDYVWNGSAWQWSEIQPASTLSLQAVRVQSDDNSGRVLSLESLTSEQAKIGVDEWAFAHIDENSGKLLFGMDRNANLRATGSLKVDGAIQAEGIAMGTPTVGDCLEANVGEGDRAISLWTRAGARWQMTSATEFEKVYDPAWIPELQRQVDGLSQAPSLAGSGLQRLVLRCSNVAQDVNLVVAGDSIAWGIGASNTGPSGPRNQRLDDPRSTLTAKSWVNLLRCYLGRRYLAVPVDAEPLVEIAPGAIEGGSGSFSQVQIAAFSDAFFVDLRDGGGVPIPRQTVATVAPAVAAAALIVPPLGYVEFDCLAVGFDLMYGKVADSTSRMFTVSVDGVLIAQQEFNDAVAGWGNTLAVALPAYRLSRVRISNAASVALPLEGMRRNKVIRVVNQGISGTSSASWLPSAPNGRRLLVDGVPVSATDILLALGTNDRIGSATPANTTWHQNNMAQVLSWLVANRSSLSVTLLAGYATLDEEGMVYQQRDIARCQQNLARMFGVSFLNLYPQMRDAIEDGQQIFSGSDLLHPNDAGHALVFRIIKQHAELFNAR